MIEDRTDERQRPILSDRARADTLLGVAELLYDRYRINNKQNIVADCRVDANDTQLYRSSGSFKSITPVTG